LKEARELRAPWGTNVLDVGAFNENTSGTIGFAEAVGNAVLGTARPNAVCCFGQRVGASVAWQPKQMPESAQIVS